MNNPKSMKEIYSGNLDARLNQLIKRGIRMLQKNEPDGGYTLGFSGGKDSLACYHLAKEAGVKFEAHFMRIGFEPDVVVNYVAQFKDVVIKDPKTIFGKDMFDIMSKKGAPYFKMMYCEELKERLSEHGDIRSIILGIRRAESKKRNVRPEIDKHKKMFQVHPILLWKREDVWNFIINRKLPYCSLYDEGWDRVGCCFCPKAPVRKKLAESKLFPEVRDKCIDALNKFYDHKKSLGTEGERFIKRFKDGEDLFYHWIAE